MSSPALIVRFPNSTEYWYSVDPPAVGDTLDRNGARYVVTGHERSADERLIVTLELDVPAGTPPPPA